MLTPPPIESLIGVRSKWYVANVNHGTHGIEVTLRVVTKGDENVDWKAASPAGELRITIDPAKTSAHQQFWPGMEWGCTLVPDKTTHPEWPAEE